MHGRLVVYLAYLPGTHAINGAAFFGLFQAVEEATETINGTFHHGDTFFGGGDDEVELLVLYFKVACTTTVNQCLHLRAHGVEVYGSCHDDDVGGNHLSTTSAASSFCGQGLPYMLHTLHPVQ